MTGKQFRAALDQLELSPDDFADRCGIHRATVFRFIAEDRVPKWAAWLVSVLIERQEIGEHLSGPAQ